MEENLPHYTDQEWNEKVEKDRPVNNSFWREMGPTPGIHSNLSNIPKENWNFPSNVRDVYLNIDGQLEITTQDWDVKKYDLPLMAAHIAANNPSGSVVVIFNYKDSYSFKEEHFIKVQKIVQLDDDRPTEVLEVSS